MPTPGPFHKFQNLLNMIFKMLLLVPLFISLSSLCNYVFSFIAAWSQAQHVSFSYIKSIMYAQTNMRCSAGTHLFSLLHLNSTKQSASNKGIHKWLSKGACCAYVNSITLQEQRAMESQHQDSIHTTQLQSWQPTARHRSLAEISDLFAVHSYCE